MDLEKERGGGLTSVVYTQFFFISIIYKQHFFQLVKFPKKISNKLVFRPEKKQHLQ